MVEYPTWKDRFFNYVIGYEASLWIAIEDEYEVPLDENGVQVTSISKMSKAQRDVFEREKKMFNQLLQGIGNEIQHQFKQFKTAKSLWYALHDRFLGNPEMIAGKQSLLRKEFEIFIPYKNESLSDLITRYCHLLSEMDEYCVNVSEAEKVMKLSDVLPKKVG